MEFFSIQTSPLPTFQQCPQPSSPLEDSQREQSQPVPVTKDFLGSTGAKLKGGEEEVELEEEEERFFRAPGIFQAPKAPGLCPSRSQCLLPPHPSLKTLEVSWGLCLIPPSLFQVKIPLWNGKAKGGALM